MNKILLVLAGGTILSTSCNGERRLVNHFSSAKDIKMIDYYCKKNGEDIYFDLFYPYQDTDSNGILSENLDVDYMNILIRNIFKKFASDKYIGVIIFHGTDTLNFSQAIFNELNKNGYKINAQFVHALSPMPNENFENYDGYMNFKNAVKNIMSNIDNISIDYQNIKDSFVLDRTTIIRAYPSIDFGVYNVENLKENIVIQGYHSCTVPVKAMKTFLDNLASSSRKQSFNIYIITEDKLAEKYCSSVEIKDYADKKSLRIFFVDNITVQEMFAKLNFNC